MEMNFKVDEERIANAVVDRVAVMGDTAKLTAASLKALCEVLNISQETMKEKMVINALKDGSKYDGDLNKDTLELIERLIKERDEAVKEGNEYRYWNNRLRKDRDKVLNIIRNNRYIRYSFPDKKKYSRDEVLDIITGVKESYAKFVQELGGALH